MLSKVLYLGLEISKKWLQVNQEVEIIHSPIIEIEERSLKDSEIICSFTQFHKYTHIILTSKVAVRLFFKAIHHFKLKKQELDEKQIIVVGKATAEAVINCGARVTHCAADETSEGIVELLKALNLTGTYFIWPCSVLSRQIIPNFLKQNKIPFCPVALYTTIPRSSKAHLSKEVQEADEIVFTSPSTVDAFVALFKEIPWNKKITAIGPVTEARLQKVKEDQLSCPPNH